jgi:GNAT superfamily N-acetyltransferase
MNQTADMSVRVAWADDAPAIARVQLATWREAYADAVAPDLTEELIAQKWRSALAAPGDARNRVLVALERNRVVAFAITLPADDSDADPIADGALAEFAVEPIDRRKGHGSRLLQACVDTLSSDRFTRVTTWVDSTDDPMRRFLTSAGWAPDGATRELSAETGETVRQVRLHTAI